MKWYLQLVHGICKEEQLKLEIHVSEDWLSFNFISDHTCKNGNWRIAKPVLNVPLKISNKILKDLCQESSDLLQYIIDKI